MTDARGRDPGFDLLSAYLDGELDDRERATVENLLSASSDARAELEAIRGAREIVRALPPRDAPAGFWDDVRAAVASDDSPAAPDSVARAPIPLGAARARRLGRFVGAAAAAAAILAVIVLPGRPQVKPDVAALVTRHGAQSADAGDPISTLAPVGPLAGLRR